MSDYNGYSQFNCVKEPQLRAFNRYQVVCNLKDLGKDDMAKGYLDSLTPIGRAAVVAIAIAVKQGGLEKVQARITREVVNG